ncbi:ACT domain-containing protein [Candidatus Micrarchaeota archaeon]|nr:ACT domain-containing protein [Candidatus Micrarchaeota archaeon]
MKQITVKLKDKPGEVYRVCDALGKKGINIVSIYGGGYDGFFKIFTEDETSTMKAFQQAGFEAAAKDVLIVNITDKPGELAKITGRLARAGINVNYMSLITKDKNSTTMGFDVDDVEKAKKSI